METIKERGIRFLYKKLEDGKLYTYKTIKQILMHEGASPSYANAIIEELTWYGVLERVRRGVYKFNKEVATEVFGLE